MAMIAHSRPRGLFVVFFLLVALSLLGNPSESQARNNYDYTDSSEGDPGDGVLRPRPKIIDPIPEIEVRTFGVEFGSIIFTADPQGRPNLLLPLLFFSPQPIWPGTGASSSGHGPFQPEGRWTHAP